jgi:Holliday junction resolvasome RuvABC endonuclease subunit
MKILSIDQSTQKSGWSIFINGKYKTHGLIDLHKDKDSARRFKEMCMNLNNLIKDNKPDLVVIEDVAAQSNIKTVIILARLQGAIIESCYLHNIEFYLIRPTEWRSLLGMKQGRMKTTELKEQTIQYVSSLLEIQNIDNDSADAIAINIAYQKLLKN